MECHCQHCGFKWVRVENGPAKCCQRCGSGWIKQMNLGPIAASLLTRIRGCNFALPPVLPPLPSCLNSSRFTKFVLILQESAISLLQILAQVEIDDKKIKNDVDFSKIGAKDYVQSNSRGGIYWAWMHDGRSFQGASPDDVKVYVNANERHLSLREAAFLLFYYPEVVGDCFLVPIGSRETPGNNVFCFGPWDGAAHLKIINAVQSHSNLIYPSMNIV